MKEGIFQKKIIKELTDIGGKAINGVYSRAGEADIQGGFPVNGILRYIAIEVKTKVDYFRVMSGVKLENDRYIIFNDKVLKSHEPMQIYKINEVRDKKGLALIAYDFKQVLEYVKDNNE